MVLDPLKNHKNIGFLGNSGLDPLKTTKLPSHHSMLGHHRPASETPHRLWSALSAILILFPLHKKTSFYICPPPPLGKTFWIRAWRALTQLSTILSRMKFTCKDGLSCTVYVTNEHIVHQLKLLIFSCIGHTPENIKRKQTPAVHTILLRVI